MMNVCYPAISQEKLPTIGEKLSIVFTLPPFRTVHQSQYLETAKSTRESFEITVTEYIRLVSSEQASQIGVPDHWDLAWRAAVGLQFNYQVRITRVTANRNQQRRIARKLRSVFTEIKLHGDRCVGWAMPTT
jgi:hypothetical protein